MKGIILHGGNGTRLRPLTYTDVKQLLPIAGKPVSQYALENLIELGIKEINIVVGDIGEREVREYYSDGSKWGVHVTYTYQEKPLGIAQAISLTKNFVGNDDFVVVLGDNYFQMGLFSLFEDFRSLKADAHVALTRVENPSQFGIATVKDNKIVGLEEKPKIPRSDLAVAGAYFLKRSIFDFIDTLKPSWRNELEITEAFQAMLDSGLNIGYSIIEGWWKDTGTIDEFLDCNRMILDKIRRKIPKEVSMAFFTGRVSIGSNVKVLGNTRILGPCYIGDNTVIDNCYVGPYTSVGSGCTIKNIEIEDSVLMDDSKIEASNGTRISQSIIGANTEVTPSINQTRTLRLVVGRDSKLEL